MRAVAITGARSILISLLTCRRVEPPAAIAHDEHLPLLLSPSIDGDASDVLIRYTFEGGALSEGRLLTMSPRASGHVSGLELLRALSCDGVDFNQFYACAYERHESSGAWYPVLRSCTEPLTALVDEFNDVAFNARSAGAAPSKRGAQPRVSKRCRIDVKLCRRDDGTLASSTGIAGAALATATVNLRRAPVNELGPGRFAALGVIDAKGEENVGTLWRSCFQLGAQLLFTVRRRYVEQRSDTLRVPTRVPLMHFEDWNAFAAAAPAGATLVAVEMGGTPLDAFEHPSRAVYLLGSEDGGLPPRVLEACGACVALSAERYSSYNVAMAGSIVLYDRLAKERQAQEERRSSES